MNFADDAMVEAVIKQVVVVSLSLPPMEIDDFFGENIVNNLATFLGVPAHKIRVVEIVREGSRRRRQTQGSGIVLEIGKLSSIDLQLSLPCYPQRTRMA